MPIRTLYVMIVACALLFGWLGHRTIKKFNVGAFVGAIVGIVLAFQQPVQRWIEPPPEHPRLIIEVPTDFKHELVIFLTDPSVDTQIQWDEPSNEGRIKAPKSGIVRLHSLGRIDNQLTYARLSNGKTNWGLTNSDVHGARLVAYRFNYDFKTEVDFGLLTEDEAAEFIRKREAE